MKRWETMRWWPYVCGWDKMLGNEALVPHEAPMFRLLLYHRSRYHINSPASKPCEVSAVSPFLLCPEVLAEVRPPLPLSGLSIVYPVSDSLEISSNEPPKSSPQSPSKEGVC